jgi:hypothetical protein
MATLTIKSPGVEIRETDLSLIAPQNIGTNVFVTGFASQGPTDEVIQISSREGLDLIYGTPSTAAERYFYYTVGELLNSSANIYTTRLPYGPSAGDGFGQSYSALVYPVRFVTPIQGYTFDVGSTSTTAQDLSAKDFSLTLSNGSTKSFGFSSTTFNPLVSTFDDYVDFTTASPFNTSTLINAISTAIKALDTTAVFLSSGTSLTYTASANLPLNSSFSFANIPTGHTYTLVQGISTNLNQTEGTYVLGSPVHVDLSPNQYQSIVDGSGYTWSSQASATSAFNSVSAFGGAGVIVLNKAQTTINSQFEGYYVGLTDNTNINPGTIYNGIIGARTINSTLTGATSTYINIPSGSLGFSLSSNFLNGSFGSISQVMENIADYDISGRDDDDLLSVGVFKLRKSVYSTEAFKLDYVIEDGIVGSIDYHRNINSALGGPAVNYFIENTDSFSRNVEIYVNDFLSNRNDVTSIVNGVPRKKVRVLSNQLLSESIPFTITGISSSLSAALVTDIGFADNIYSLGTFNSTKATTKDMGSIPTKLDRALDGVRNEDIYDIDVVVEAGLGTIYSSILGGVSGYYDETSYSGDFKDQVEALRTSSSISSLGETLRGNYSVIFDKFENFCSPAHIGGGRGDCVFIADPIRQILVTSTNNKILNNKAKNFTTDVYWPIRHQFELQNTSYGVVYGNWAKVFDTFTGQQVWVPFSGHAAAAMARTDAARFPWIAPAGFTNGLVTNSIDLAVNPNQKQRDEFYRSNINPVSFFPAQGQVIYGQKTLSKKPSAFDRINVRRLFLSLERPTRKAAQFFVFEPNTTFTRTRLINTLTPIFDRAKNNEGLYDYLIVCDERNNTPEVIDNNQLVVDIYIKPVRAAEFILINFFATRTDASFQEIVGA